MFDLLDNACLSGTSQDELEATLNELVHHTGFTSPVLPQKLDLLSLTGVSGKSVSFTAVRTSSSIESGKDNPLLIQSFPVNRVEPAASTTPDLLRETVSHGVMLKCPSWNEPVHISAHAVDDLLSMVNISGKGTAHHSFELMALLSRGVLWVWLPPQTFMVNEVSRPSSTAVS